VEDGLLNLLATADGDHRTADSNVVQRAPSVLQAHARRRRQEATAAATELNAARISRRLALWQEYHDNAQPRLDGRPAENLIREAHRPATIVGTRIAEGLLHVAN